MPLRWNAELIQRLTGSPEGYTAHRFPVDWKSPGRILLRSPGLDKVWRGLCPDMALYQSRRLFY